MNSNSVVTVELNNEKMSNVLPSVVEIREAVPDSSWIQLSSLRKYSCIFFNCFI